MICIICSTNYPDDVQICPKDGNALLTLPEQLKARNERQARASAMVPVYGLPPMMREPRKPIAVDPPARAYGPPPLRAPEPPKSGPAPGWPELTEIPKTPPPEPAWPPLEPMKEDPRPAPQPAPAPPQPQHAAPVLPPAHALPPIAPRSNRASVIVIAVAMIVAIAALILIVR